MKRTTSIAVFALVCTTPFSSFARPLGIHCRSLLGYELTAKMVGTRLQNVEFRSEQRLLLKSSAAFKAKVLRDVEQLEWRIQDPKVRGQMTFHLPMNLESVLFPGEIEAITESSCVTLALDCWRE